MRLFRTWTVTLTVLSIIISLFVTVWADAYQSQPVNADAARLLFAEVLLFGLVLEFYFVGLLRAPRRR